MAAIRCTANMIVKEIFHVSLSLRSEQMFQMVLPNFSVYCGTVNRGISYSRIRCAAADSGDGRRKVSARLSQVQQLLQEAEERSLSFGNEPTPKITLGIWNLPLSYMLWMGKKDPFFFFFLLLLFLIQQEMHNLLCWSWKHILSWHYSKWYMKSSSQLMSFFCLLGLDRN